MENQIQRKKIIYVITKANWGGAQSYVYDLATSLPKNHFEAIVVFGERGKLSEQLEIAGIKTIEIESLGRNINPVLDIKSLIHLFKIFKKESPDIIHLNSSKIGFIGSLAGRLSNVRKIIFTAHGWAFNEDRGLLFKFVTGLAHLITVFLCHKTITVSEKTRNDISFLIPAKSKTVLIYNGIKHFNLRPKKDARDFFTSIIPSLKNIPADTIWIGTNSELHKNKGLDFMIDSLKNVRQKFPKFIFIITSNGEEKENLLKMIEKNNLEKNVFLSGFVINAKEYLKAFDIFTLTSRTEALPYALIEAGFAGLPIIASKVGGIPEIIDGPNYGILIQKGNNTEIEKNLFDLMTDKEKRDQLGQNLENRVKERFSFEKMLQETIKVYES